LRNCGSTYAQAVGDALTVATNLDKPVEADITLGMERPFARPDARGPRLPSPRIAQSSPA
jgi:hypothetical protein